MSPSRTPSATKSLLDASDTVTYRAPRYTRGATFDSKNHPNRPMTGPATGHCSLWQWCVSNTTGLRVNSRAKNGIPFCVSTTTSGRLRQIDNGAARYTLNFPPARS